MELRDRARSGFTLVEMIMAVAATGILIIVLARLFTQVSQGFSMTQARGEVQRDLRDVLTDIQKEIRNGKVSTFGFSRDAGQPLWSRVSFQNVDGTTVTYRQQANFLFKSRGGVEKRLTQNLRHIAFIPRLDSNIFSGTNFNRVSVNLVMEKRSLFRKRTQSASLFVDDIEIMNP